METFFNKVKASVRKPDEVKWVTVILNDGGMGIVVWQDDCWRVERDLEQWSFADEIEYWLEELPVLTEVLFNTPNCWELKTFKLDVATGDKYAEASRMALRTYAYTIKAHDSRLARTLCHCVDKQKH